MKKTKLFLMTLIVAAGFVSCSDDDDSNNPEGTAQVAVKLTDAPGDYQEVNVEVIDVMIKTDAEGEAVAGDAEAETEEEGWVSLGVEPQTINLLELTGGNTLFLGETELAAGNLQEMRLILGDNNNIVVGGQTLVLDTPSAQQSGLKLKVDQELVADTYYSFILDFDVDQSVVAQGNGGYSLKPVLRLAVEEDAGSIAGTVTPSTDQVVVKAESADVTTTAYVNAEGRFQLHGLKPGTYLVTVTPSEASGLEVKTINNVEVKQGEVTELEPVLLDTTEETSTGE
ncbi:DUF4382 domain-containing protein [Salinimicrobium gaetbulicola]|uniref:DUF4382 domain-containing protein n=1 Tax=Salinimicrobium gaetbulicola TaxID=999702 RepID=A0ABW3IIK4_9FLAO